MLWLAVAGPDQDAARRAIDKAWEDSLDEESRAAVDHGVVDLDADEAQCPACGASIDPKVGRCTDCGLNLGGGADPGGEGEDEDQG